jgi:hypothetical protein
LVFWIASLATADFPPVNMDYRIEGDDSRTVVIFSFKDIEMIGPLSLLYSPQVEDGDGWKDLECEWQYDGTGTYDGEPYWIAKCEVPCPIEGLHRYRILYNNPEPGSEPSEKHRALVTCSESAAEPSRIESKDASVVADKDASSGEAGDEAGTTAFSVYDSGLGNEPEDPVSENDTSVTLSDAAIVSKSEDVDAPVTDDDAPATDAEDDDRKSRPGDCGCSVQPLKSNAIQFIVLGLLLTLLFRKGRSR